MKETDKVKTLYINCFEFSSRHSILTEIANFVEHPMPRRGIASDEAFTAILESIKKIHFSPLIILDEFDQLVRENQANALLYDLLRMNNYSKKAFTLIMISNNKESLTKLDDRVKSSLSQETIEFKSYTPQELKGILKERSKLAFLDDVLDEDVINVAAAHAAKNNGDARIAIEALWKAGKQAVKENAETVSVAHIRQGLKSIYSRILIKSKPSLSENEKLVLKLLCGQKEISSGELFEKFSKKNPDLSDRSFRKIISRLDELSLINAVEHKHENKGMTRLISLNVEEEAVKNELLNE